MVILVKRHGSRFALKITAREGDELTFAGRAWLPCVMLHCTKAENHLYARLGGPTGVDHGVQDRIVSRPRPEEQARYRAALALLHAMSNADRTEIGIKPADFPRIAREMSVK